MYSYKVDAGGSCFVRPFPPSLPHSLLFLFPLPSCDTCIQREFARKTRGGFRCPACARLGKDREVLRQSLETKSREQLMVELDTKWRERVLEVYGKKEEDFKGNEDAYNDYIEEREDLSTCFERGEPKQGRVTVVCPPSLPPSTHPYTTPSSPRSPEFLLN